MTVYVARTLVNLVEHIAIEPEDYIRIPLNQSEVGTDDGQPVCISIHVEPSIFEEERFFALASDEDETDCHQQHQV